MAINNWRYVVTWGYMDPDGNIIEERQRVPATNTTPVVDNRTEIERYFGTPVSNWDSSYTFSPLENFKIKAEWYGNIWDKAMSTVYWDLANSLGQYSSYANNTLWAYDNLLDYLAWNEARLQSAAGNLYSQLAWDINNQRNYVYSMFWPQWQLTQEVNKYYDDLWNYLSSEAWREAAKIAAQWMHSWASLWSIRAQQDEAYNQAFGRYVQAKEQEINAKQQIASNLINFMSTLRQEYWDTTNQYIIDLYKRANDLYNNVAISVAWDLDQYNKLKLSYSSSGWGSNSSWVSLNLPTWYSYDSNWNIIDSEWNQYEIKDWKLVKKSTGVISTPTNNLWLTNNSSRHTWVDTAKWRIRTLNKEIQSWNYPLWYKTASNLWTAGTYVLPNTLYELLWF